MYEADVHAPDNTQFLPANNLIKHVPFVLSSINPSTHLYSSVHHSSFWTQPTISAEPRISLCRPLRLQLRVEELLTACQPSLAANADSL